MRNKSDVVNWTDRQAAYTEFEQCVWLCQNLKRVGIESRRSKVRVSCRGELRETYGRQTGESRYHIVIEEEEGGRKERQDGGSRDAEIE
jgi:hypothetical protein